MRASHCELPFHLHSRFKIKNCHAYGIFLKRLAILVGVSVGLMVAFSFLGWESFSVLVAIREAAARVGEAAADAFGE